MIDYARCPHDVPVLEFCALCEADKQREPSTNAHNPEHAMSFDGDALDPTPDPGRDCEASLADWLELDGPELTTAERMNCAEVRASLDAANDREWTGPIEAADPFTYIDGYTAPHPIDIDALCERIDRAMESTTFGAADDVSSRLFELISALEAPKSVDELACTLSVPAPVVQRALDNADRYERVAGSHGWEWRISWWQRLRENHGVTV